jgi:hypothetical protein
MLHPDDDIGTKLQDYFAQTCDLLFGHEEIIEMLADRLAYKGQLSARSVAAILRACRQRT